MATGNVQVANWNILHVPVNRHDKLEFSFLCDDPCLSFDDVRCLTQASTERLRISKLKFHGLSLKHYTIIYGYNRISKDVKPFVIQAGCLFYSGISWKNIDPKYKSQIHTESSSAHLYCPSFFLHFLLFFCLTFFLLTFISYLSFPPAQNYLKTW